MFPHLVFEELVTLKAEAELRNFFREDFDQYSRVNNPTNGGEKVFVFDALRLLEGARETWKEFYDALEDYCEELLEENRLLLEEKNNPIKEVGYRLQKAQGELAFKRNHFNQLQQH